MIQLNNPSCSFTTNGSGELIVSIKVSDLSQVNPDTKIEFKDVLYHVTSSVRLPVPKIVVNVPTMNIQTEMVPVVLMKETLTTCEDIIIDFSNSKGLGYKTTVSIKLQSVEDTATKAVLTTSLASAQTTINTEIAKLIVQSPIIKLSKSYITQLAGKTVYFAIVFKNELTGEVKSLARKVMITSDTRLEVQDQVLKISRDMNTTISTVKRIS
mmetsp:Transcript_42743/g.50084  ORF Transcript_42743/g.50084 Transcript_42743/m.50084 type:complete len:212 (-) Transcript_42743:144-779(-)